jgi:hypothetical protein
MVDRGGGGEVSGDGDVPVIDGSNGPTHEQQ